MFERELRGFLQKLKIIGCQRYQSCLALVIRRTFIKAHYGNRFLIVNNVFVLSGRYYTPHTRMHTHVIHIHVIDKKTPRVINVCMQQIFIVLPMRDDHILYLSHPTPTHPSAGGPSFNPGLRTPPTCGPPPTHKLPPDLDLTSEIGWPSPGGRVGGLSNPRFDAGIAVAAENVVVTG